MILVFDLDDTLYDEICYVQSGLRAVADFMAQQWHLESSAIYRRLTRTLNEHGRGRVFDTVLSHYGRLTQANVHRCLGIYRHHKPLIKLHRAGEQCLRRFGTDTRYLVTDGNKLVQYNKVKALGLEQRFKRVFITHRFGIKHAKPSPHCFKLIAKAENLSPHNIVYIGDNPAKDFVGIKPLGFKTVRVLTGMHSDVRLPQRFEADVSIGSLDELTPELIDKLQG